MVRGSKPATPRDKPGLFPEEKEEQGQTFDSILSSRRSEISCYFLVCECAPEGIVSKQKYTCSLFRHYYGKNSRKNTGSLENKALRTLYDAMQLLIQTRRRLVRFASPRHGGI